MPKPTRKPTRKPKSSRATPAQFRINGGEWRSRRFGFADAPGLRPTPDRVRETLFNWLQQPIINSRCLDAFAGSGALGLEALSRGAHHVDFVDALPAATQQIQQHLQTLEANSKANVYGQSALTLSLPPQPYDIVFLDPPFSQDWLPKMLQHLQQDGFTHANTLLYIEAETATVLNQLNGLIWQKQKQAGQVNYGLATLQT